MNRLRTFLGYLAWQCVIHDVAITFKVKSNDVLQLHFQKGKRNFTQDVAYSFIDSPQIDLADWTEKIYEDVKFRLK